MHLGLISNHISGYLSFLPRITNGKELAQFSRLMFSSERGRRFGLSGDIFRKLYPRPLLHREFSGQSRMIPQILRFRERSSAREFQLRRTDLTAAPPLDGRIRLRESSCLRETFDYVNADLKQWISTLNGKYMKKLFFAESMRIPIFGIS